MNTIKKYVIWSVLLSALIGLSGCGNSSSDVGSDVNSDVDSGVYVIIPSDDAKASDFSMTLDVEESTVEGDWKALSSASGDDPLSASVVTQGNYGNFVVEDDALRYLKTVETNETDTGILEISNNSGTVQVTVTVHSLYWKQISEADGHTSAIKSDGTLWSWGVNNDGQLGNGTTDDSTVPVQEDTGSAEWVSTSSGGNHTAAVKSNGTIWSWGLNGYGQLGDGTRDNSAVPVQEETEATDWSSVRCGDGYSVAKKFNGEKWRWGRRNTPPVANDQSVVTDENVAKAIKLTGSDADNDPLTYIVVSGPSNGTLTGTAPNLTYTPDTDYDGADSFTFKVNDGTVDSKVATVSITVNPVVDNTAPVANDQSVVTDENVAVAVTLTGSDADNDPLAYTVVSDPSNGTLTGTAPNLTYTPNTDYDGPDSFTFTVNDGTVDSAPATVSITVNAGIIVNTPPVANDQAVVTNENVAAAITLTGSDADSDPLTYAVVNGPSNGTLTGTAPNLTYTPNTDYDGADSFIFTVNDGTVDSAPATVSITVNPVVVNTPPVANDQAVVTDENVAKAITLTGSDADGDPLTYAVVDTPSNGTLSGTAPNLTYTPNTDYDGLDSFTFKVNDGTEDSAVATVSITVNSVYASADALAQIGLESDDPDVVDSNITIAQLNVILPVLTDINAAYETAYQDYIDENPDAFSSPATQEEVQAMIDAVNAEQSAIAASDAVLAQIGLEADDPDTVNSVVTVAQLNLILPVLTDVTAANETAYQDYIDENPELFSSPATQAEVQAMVDAINSIPTASDFNMTLDVNESEVIGDWTTLSSADDADGDSLTALVKTQGAYGTCIVTDDSLAYLKTIETNATDTCELEISDGTDIVEITVTVNALYWNQISAGGDHTVALKSDGTLWAWGDNDYGQLGDGTTTDRVVPVQESTAATDWISVDTGARHTVALKTDGTLWAWGSNGGQLGDGTATNRSIPVQEATAATDWSTVVAGSYYTVAVKTDGTLWAWGSNFRGQLGDGTTTTSYIPVQEATAATDWSSVSAGDDHTVALKTDGTLWGWGDNGNGELGDGTITDRVVPVLEITAATDWISVDTGARHTVALKTDGTLWAWGYNGYGELGDGTTTDRVVPVQESTAATDWSSVSAGVRGGYSGHTVALKTDGTLWAWGSNGYGQLGNGTVKDVNPVLIQESTAATDWSSVSTGGAHTVALKLDGTLWAWGNNDDGKLGNGTTTNSFIPVQEITAATDWSSVSAADNHTVALKTDGTLWAWGAGYHGQLGDGTTSLVAPRPVQEATAATDWSVVKTGTTNHTIALKTDGTLWAWGNNSFGQLGDGTTTNRSIPVQEVTAATDWISVDTNRHTVALKTDGTLWAWGYNGSGQLGDGTTTTSSIPVQESTAATDWSSVSAAYVHTAAMKTDGTLWGWGHNELGQLGDGTTTTSSIPVQESTAATDWNSMSADRDQTVAIKSDGTLWSYGKGYLGDGTYFSSSIPVQEITAATDWISVDRGGDYTVALKTDGTLWAWGYNYSGKLGDGTTSNSYIPVQEVTVATDWISVSAGLSHTAAIKSDGTLWLWGDNDYGQLSTWVVEPALSQPRQP